MSSRNRMVVFAIYLNLLERMPSRSSAIFQRNAPTDGILRWLVSDEWQHCHASRALDRLGDAALILGRDARDAARHDLAALGDELPQKVDVLPIYVLRNNLTRAATLVATRAIANYVF